VAEPTLGRVVTPAERHVVIFDGDCGFCRFWVARWRHWTGNAVEYVPFQAAEGAQRFPEIPRERFARAVQLVEPGGRVFEAAEAVAHLSALGGKRMPLWAYAHVPGVAPVSERAYRVIADHRSVAAAVTRFLWGSVAEPSTYARTTLLFLRLLGLVYLLAFWSLAGQILGLVGHDGIQPADRYLAAARALPGLERFWMLPTLAWVSQSDLWLRAMCWGGVALALLVVAGFLPSVALTLLWLTYLSVSIVCGEFLSYQWDALLLETGLLAIFLVPSTKDQGPSVSDPPRLARWLLLWLLFRLMVGSGIVKLASGDPTWHNLTALTFHFNTQPIPTPLAWYAHQLPVRFLKGATAGVLAIEIGVPFLIVAPRRVRLVAFVLLVGVQALIALTGNYAFFNLLTVALCILLLDDATLRRRGIIRAERVVARGPRCRLLTVVAILTIPVSLVAFTGSLGIELPGSALIYPLASLLAPFRSVNTYGLFAVMTTTRPEIVLEGSDDGARWLEYEFKYKAGDVRRAPPWIAPHQPRLDWQMWFAALGSFSEERWFQEFCVRVLEADNQVLQLLERDPFQGRKPRYLRAVLYRYQFTDWSGRDGGAWWRRERVGDYSPVLSVNER
jgi:predicted DCC family thiol-disulfide oxidoreductase YuxK